ncbi:photosynthetic complex assembly protein [Ectothiorhodospira haloalkaliphila]|uniref:Photosynthetic complex assembly protein n=1 Tax=Ectothiorhodospira haloalkaliphila TaxID=421628 RepID=W8KHA8_9GAMM|nr:MULTISPECIES: photosynthetic complex assembly protein PuhC [Ectothiorhodospira]AHK79139.1 photosynthetic complex assembly protein [Ectothiorhodospira haloalkaliphila]MCG5495041.1 hypothetical protein [Ectothiorhodospira variabilis]MCG5498582.1 hypothetical protein [Ectothiorhodospira variabilis]MCG5504628.1 hypothetical protein [Ectothiorhodospira variabilis]MCG5507819.1 hypothetical protein [Ectothiorhodospira variabilis]
MTDSNGSSRSPRRFLFPGIGVILLAIAFGVYYLASSAVSPPASTEPATTAEPAEQDLTVVQSVRLKPREKPGGYMEIVDADTNQVLKLIEPSGGGFMRTVLRIIALDRRHLDDHEDLPFLLTRWSDGGLSLEDPVTGNRYKLNAFGSTNAAAFAELLDSAQDS